MFRTEVFSYLGHRIIPVPDTMQASRRMVDALDYTTHHTRSNKCYAPLSSDSDHRDASH